MEEYIARQQAPYGEYRGFILCSSESIHDETGFTPIALSLYEGITVLHWRMQVSTDRPRFPESPPIPLNGEIAHHIGIADDLETTYHISQGGWGGSDEVWHGTVFVRPGVPADASQLILYFDPDLPQRTDVTPPWKRFDPPVRSGIRVDVNLANMIRDRVVATPLSLLKEPVYPTCSTDSDTDQRPNEKRILLLNREFRLANETLYLEFASLTPEGGSVRGWLSLDDDHPELAWRRLGRGGEPSLSLEVVDGTGRSGSMWLHATPHDPLNARILGHLVFSPSPHARQLHLLASEVRWFTESQWQHFADESHPRPVRYVAETFVEVEPDNET